MREAQTPAKQNLPPRASKIGQTVRENDPRDCRSFSTGAIKAGERVKGIYLLTIFGEHRAN